MFFGVTCPPCCIDPTVHCIICALQSGADLKCVCLVWYKVVSTQMEVDFDTHLKSIRHKLKWIRYKLKSFHSKSELAEMMYPSESLFMFASHMIAIDRKNVIPGEESCLSGGLETFYGSWIRWTSSLKPARFQRKSDEPHSGTNHPASLVSSKRGNSIMISGIFKFCIK